MSEIWEVSPFILIDPATGEILQHGEMQIDVIDSLIAAGQHYLKLQGHYESAYYDLLAQEVRLKVPVPHTVSGTTISSLPSPTTLTLTGPDFPAQDFTVYDGQAALSLTESGTWSVTLKALNRLPVTLEFVIP